MRITNRLRAIRDREVRWINEQTYTGGTVRQLGRIIPKGPYKAWDPRRQVSELLEAVDDLTPPWNVNAGRHAPSI